MTYFGGSLLHFLVKNRKIAVYAPELPEKLAGMRVFVVELTIYSHCGEEREG